MADTNDKSGLSKNLLQMKFMRRSVIRLEKEQNEDDHQRVIDEEHWVLDLPELKEKQTPFETEPSIVPCEDLLFSRMSFKGFNPDVEKLMASKNIEHSLAVSEEKEREIGVDEDEMVKRYESLIGTIAKKYAQKRKRQQQSGQGEEESGTNKLSKKHFMKPVD